MRIAQPVIQKRQAEIKSRYANNLQKQQEELGKVMKSSVVLWRMSPLLCRCDPLRPVRHPEGSPFADVPHDQPQGSASRSNCGSGAQQRSHSIFIAETDHVPVIASLRGTKLGVGDSATVNLHTKDGRAR